MKGLERSDEERRRERRHSRWKARGRALAQLRCLTEAAGDRWCGARTNDPRLIWGSWEAVWLSDPPDLNGPGRSEVEVLQASNRRGGRLK